MMPLVWLLIWSIQLYLNQGDCVTRSGPMLAVRIACWYCNLHFSFTAKIVSIVDMMMMMTGVWRWPPFDLASTSSPTSCVNPLYKVGMTACHQDRPMYFGSVETIADSSKYAIRVKISSSSLAKRSLLFTHLWTCICCMCHLVPLLTHLWTCICCMWRLVALLNHVHSITRTSHY